MAYEALYRRYRPSRFQDAFFGQDHVVAALRNAIEGDRVGHAYLFSGPRGTGKTTSARILAKALNCTNLQGGEPCNECDSCLEFQSSGGSYNLHELDAASNNGVDAMRDLIGKVALGSPGRTKVYILDEVHMLSSGAENALLKTLEEPPPHVVFVLCTTEPNKVVPTIRSRTQHLEFSLLTASQVAELVDHVTSDAGIELAPEDRNYVIRAGGGSARDTLSALDQVVAAGGAPQGGEHLAALFQALVDRDAQAALAAIDGALQAGRDAAGIGTALLHELRTVFLATMRADLGHLPEAERDLATARAADMPPARVTRAIEVIGTSLIEMRQAPDPRVDLEVALMRLTRHDLDTDPAALLERLEAVEGRLAGGDPILPRPAAETAESSAPDEPAARAATPGRQADAPAAAVATDPANAPAAEPEPGPATTAERPSTPTPAAKVSERPAAPGSGPPAGRRGADLARAELARQGAAPADESADSPSATRPSGRTLADVRRERQEAARSTADASDDTDVETAAAERRTRQQAVQAERDAHAATDSTSPVSSAQHSTAPETASAVPAPSADTNADSGPTADGSADAPTTAATQSGAESASIPTVAELEAVWPDLLESMSGRVRSRFSAGHFVESADANVQFGLPNPVHRDRCEEVRAEVDQALAAHFGPVPLTLVVDMVEAEPDFFTPPSGGAGGLEDTAAEADYEEEAVDVHDLVDATDDAPSAADRVMATFENSVLLDDPPNPHPHQ